MVSKTGKENLKSLFLVAKLVLAFTQLFMAGAFAQEEIKEADNTDKSEKSDHKEAHKEHHEEENKDEVHKISRVSPVILYLYAKILLIVVLGSFAAIVLLSVASRNGFFRIIGS